MVDRKLFPHDLAIAAILKNEGHYIKEWLDYHLLAGVDHFYLYDNDSADDYAEIIAPYVAAGLVTNVKLSGGSAQYAAYNFAVRDHRFHCRHMAFIDLDEFIFPRGTVRSIGEVVDEILAAHQASGVAVNWQLFGSNGNINADFSRGVLERFTRRAPTDWVVPIPKRDIPGGNAQVKTIADPRRIAFVGNSHFPVYFVGNHSVNERGGRVDSYCNEPVTAERIAINHYNVKSRAEHAIKVSRGRADKGTVTASNAREGNCINDAWFDIYDRNEVFDDSIISYRAARAENFSIETEADRCRRMTHALTETLSDVAAGAASDLETALTCRAACSYLRGHSDDVRLKIFGDAALAAVVKSLDGLTLSEAQLFISELPSLLASTSPVVDELQLAALQVVEQMMDFMREHEYWKDFADLDHLRRLIKIFGK